MPDQVKLHRSKCGISPQVELSLGYVRWLKKRAAPTDPKRICLFNRLENTKCLPPLKRIFILTKVRG